MSAWRGRLSGAAAVLAMVGAGSATSAAAATKEVPYSVTFTATGTVRDGMDPLGLFGGGDLTGLTYVSTFTLIYDAVGYGKFSGPFGHGTQLDTNDASASVTIGGGAFALTGHGTAVNAVIQPAGGVANDRREVVVAPTTYHQGAYFNISSSASILREPSQWLGLPDDPTELFLANTVGGEPGFGFANIFYVHGQSGPDILRTWAHFDVTSITSTFETRTIEVPEPQTWALLIGGFGAVGMVMRRRRDRPAAAA